MSRRDRKIIFKNYIAVYIKTSLLKWEVLIEGIKPGILRKEEQETGKPYNKT